MHKILSYPALKSKYLFILVLLLLIAHCIWSYSFWISFPMSDLHYRITGSRLLQNNLSPYFYQWHTGDSIFFFDKNMFLPNGVNGVTVTPFLLWLHKPLASLDFCTAKYYWWVIDEILIFGTIYFASLLITKLLPQLLLIAVAALFFCFGNLWIFAIWVGQCYILFGFIFSFASWLLIKYKNEKFIYYIFPLAVLIRPFFVLAFLPFLMSSLLKHKIHFFAGIGITILLLFFSGTWKILPEYSKAMGIYAQEQLHWKPNSRQQINNVNINYDCSNTNTTNISIKGSGGLYSLQHYLQLKGYAIDAQLFYTITLLVFVALFLLLHQKQILAAPQNLIIASFLLYMFSELCTPAIRQGYNLIQYTGIIGVVFYCGSRISILLFMIGIIINNQLSKYWGYAAEVGEILMLVSLYSCLFLGFKKQKTEIKAN